MRISTEWCVNGQGCLGAMPADRRDGHGALTAGGPLCRSCLDASRADLRALVLDYADLEQLLVAGRTHTLMVSGTREPPIPYAIGIDALQRDIWLMVTTWEEIIRDVARLAEPAIRVRPGWAVQHGVAILEPRVDLMATVGPTAVHVEGQPTDQTGLEALDAFTGLHRRALAALGLTRRVERLYGACPVCGRESLRREAGSERVYCGHCRSDSTWDDYHRLIAFRVEEAKRHG